MKFLAGILLFYFSSLIAQPMVTLVHNRLTKEKQVCVMACCQKHKVPEKKQTSKFPFGCCANDMTNPFAQCCCCIGFIPVQQTIGITILPNSTILIYKDTKGLIPNYSSDCWRPPELAA
jgi:hypothetical protein